MGSVSAALPGLHSRSLCSQSIIALICYVFAFGINALAHYPTAVAPALPQLI
ncbi:hypothetical protein DAEQUDRAFT_732641 [Daedalea quercina L-15889]|uniref:Uncharacterized protein n=1 Tax=Daedalea quercina L-15889 TaxID=1314783 RepID=A0A165LHA5_9APHY|nr:hypothetical protein DAEQUDRAFT_732641 [Daedalea quercina L-15889]